MKKRVIQLLTALLTFALLLCSFTACQSDKNIPQNDENSQLDNSNIFDSFQNDKSQDNNQQKNIVEIFSNGQIPYDKFEYLGQHGLETTDKSLFPFNYSSKYGFADANGNVVISEQYDDVHLFSEGKAFVESNDSWKIIDTNGNELYRIPTEFNKALSASNTVKFKNSKSICACLSRESSDYFVSVLIINSNLTTSQIKIPANNAKVNYKIINTPEFAGIITYNSYVEYDESGIKKDKLAYRLFDLSGNKIWEIETLYETLHPRIDQSEYMKALGATSSAGVLESIKVENGYINIFDENFKWGLMNLSTGEFVLDCSYDYVGTYSDNLCNVCSYGKWGYVDLNGIQSFDFNYKYTEKFVNGQALAISQDDSFVIIDKTGEVVFDCGIKFNQPSYTQIKYQIHTDLQEQGIIVIWSYHNDEYYLINIGDSTKNIDEGLHPAIASQDNIFINKTMFELV